MAIKNKDEDNSKSKKLIEDKEELNPEVSKKSIDHGKNIAWFRQAAGLTKTEFAKKAGVTVQAVSAWEQSVKLSDNILQKAAKVLNVGIEWLRDRTPSEFMQYSINGNNNTNFLNNQSLTYNNYPLDKLEIAYTKTIDKLDKVYETFIERQKELTEENSKNLNDYIQKQDKLIEKLQQEKDVLMQKIFEYINRN